MTYRKTTHSEHKKAGEFSANRYQCKVCGSTTRLFGQCSPCLQKFIKANGIDYKRFVNQGDVK